MLRLAGRDASGKRQTEAEGADGRAAGRERRGRGPTLALRARPDVVRPAGPPTQPRRLRLRLQAEEGCRRQN